MYGCEWEFRHGGWFWHLRGENVEVQVVPRYNGGWQVVLFDIETAQVLRFVDHYDTAGEAKASVGHANRWGLIFHPDPAVASRFVAARARVALG